MPNSQLGYGFFEELGTGNIDFNQDTIKCALLSIGSNHSADTRDWNTLSANETTGTEYTSGGEAISGITFDAPTGNAYTTFDCADVTWGSVQAGATISAEYAVLYHVTSDTVLCILNIGEQTATNGTFKLQFHDNGVFRLSAT